MEVINFAELLNCTLKKPEFLAVMGAILSRLHLMLRIVATLLLTFSCCSPGYAGSEVRSLDDWSTYMLRKLPFVDGQMSAKNYADVSSAYVENMTKFYWQSTENKINAARKAGRKRAERFFEHQRDRQIERLKTYAHDTEKGVMKSLDPLRTGVVNLGDARLILLEIAKRSDFNNNGLLEAPEADMAEAAFVRGVDLTDPGAIDKMIYELDQDENWWR